MKDTLMFAKKWKCLLNPSSFSSNFWLPLVWDSLTQLTVQEREHTSQDLRAGRVFMSIIDTQGLYWKSLVDFLLSSGSPRTLQGWADGNAEFLRTFVGSVFSININIFLFQHKFFILDRIILYIDYRSKNIQMLIRKVKDAPLANKNFILGFMHLVFYIMFLFLYS